MLTEVESLVGGINDDGIVIETVLLERVHEGTDAFINGLHTADGINKLAAIMASLRGAK